MTFAHRVHVQRAAQGTSHSGELVELQPSLRWHYAVSTEQLIDVRWTRPGQPVGPDADAATAELSALLRVLFASESEPSTIRTACWEG